MAHIVCIANHKGGVGKTTTAVNLSTALAIAEKKSLLVDCDPQGHATVGMGIDKNKLNQTIYHVITGKAVNEKPIIASDLEHLQMLPAHEELYRAETELKHHPGKESQLRRFLKTLREMGASEGLIDRLTCTNILKTFRLDRDLFPHNPGILTDHSSDYGFDPFIDL